LPVIILTLQKLLLSCLAHEMSPPNGKSAEDAYFHPVCFVVVWPDRYMTISEHRAYVLLRYIGTKLLRYMSMTTSVHRVIRLRYTTQTGRTISVHPLRYTVTSASQCRINYGSGGSPEPGPLNSGGLIIPQK